MLNNYVYIRKTIIRNGSIEEILTLFDNINDRNRNIEIINKVLRNKQIVDIIFLYSRNFVQQLHDAKAPMSRIRT